MTQEGTEASKPGEEPRNDNGDDGTTGDARRPRRHRKQYWNDRGFRDRVQELAQQQNVAVADVMVACGCAVDYVYKSADARNTNIVMAIADYFGVSPADLARWTSEDALQSTTNDTPPNASPPRATAEEDREMRRLTAVVRLFSEQTVGMLYVVLAMTRPDIDVRAIADAIGLDHSKIAAAMGGGATGSRGRRRTE